MGGSDNKGSLKQEDAKTYAAGLKTIPGITKNYIANQMFDTANIKNYFTEIIKLVAPWCCNSTTQNKYKTFKNDKKGLAMESMTKMKADLDRLRTAAVEGKPLLSPLKRFTKNVSDISRKHLSPELVLCGSILYLVVYV